MLKIKDLTIELMSRQMLDSSPQRAGGKLVLGG